MPPTQCLSPPRAAESARMPAGDRHVWVERRFQTRLARAGLRTLDEIMATSAGRCLRALKDRENWYLPPEDSSAALAGMYLKKHHIRTWTTRLRAWLGMGPGRSAGRVEAENVRHLTNLGIGVMPLAAFGEKLHGDGRLESFLLTEELAGYEELQEFVRRRFPSRTAAWRDGEMDRLIRQVAAIASRLHSGGFNHRDFYCCHFLVKEGAAGRFDIRLIDLQRVEHRRWFRRRWIVKDLAQLSYSIPRDRIGRRHQVAFLRHYFGVRKLRPSHKRLIRAVAGKQRRMTRKLGEDRSTPLNAPR